MTALLFASFIGFASVALGAFGAHALADRLGDLQRGWWETATLYGLVHAAVLAALGLTRSEASLPISMAPWMFFVGVLLFSGTLYLMAIGAPRWFGAITPVGGLALLGGWICIFWIAISASGR